MVHPPFYVSVCPSPALGLGWFGHKSVAPPTAPVCWVPLGSRLRRSVTLASGCTLSLCFLAWGFLPWALFGLGLVGCSPAGVPAFFWGNSPSFVLVFAWRFLQFGCPGSCSFLGIFAWVLSSRFLCLDSLGWLRMVLGCPPSVAWRRRLLPWFSVRYCSACPRGAAVPLDSSVLRCSWSS